MWLRGVCWRESELFESTVDVIRKDEEGGGVIYLVCTEPDSRYIILFVQHPYSLGRDCNYKYPAYTVSSPHSQPAEAPTQALVHARRPGFFSPAFIRLQTAVLSYTAPRNTRIEEATLSALRLLAGCIQKGKRTAVAVHFCCMTSLVLNAAQPLTDVLVLPGDSTTEECVSCTFQPQRIPRLSVLFPRVRALIMDKTRIPGVGPWEIVEAHVSPDVRVIVCASTPVHKFYDIPPLTRPLVALYQRFGATASIHARFSLGCTPPSWETGGGLQLDPASVCSDTELCQGLYRSGFPLCSVAPVYHASRGDNHVVCYRRSAAPLGGDAPVAAGEGCIDSDSDSDSGDE